MKRTNLLLGLCGLWLAGCSSTSSLTHHTLQPAPQGSVAMPPVNLLLDPIQLPPQVDRSQLVVRRDDTRLVILENDWWSATLADDLHSALLDQLAQGLKGQVGPVDPLRVRAIVHHFDLLPGRSAVLAVDWQLLQRDAEGWRCQAAQETPALAGIGSLVQAQQDNVRLLAEKMVRSILAPEAAGFCQRS